MPYLIKEAAVTAKSLKHLKEILEASGKVLEDGSADKAIKKMVEKGGSGSMIYDATSSIPKKILRFGGRKVEAGKGLFGRTKYKRVDTVGDKIKDGLDGAVNAYKRKATDVDMKAANFINDKVPLRKKPFMAYKDFKVKGEQGHADELLHVGTPSLSAPIDKVKKAVLPMVGSVTIANQVQKITTNKKKEDEGGEAMKNANNNETLINKVAKTIIGEDPIVVIATEIKNEGKLEKLAVLSLRAADMLKVASAENQELKSQGLEKDAQINKLKLEVMAKTRSGRAVKLAHDMYSKGIVKKADINIQTDKIMDMNDEAFEILADTIENAPLIKEASEEGIDSLRFIGAGESMTSERKTMADEVKTLVDQAR